MKILIILAHPNPESFNHAIAARGQSTLQGLGHEVILRDLYAEEFDAMLTIEELDPQAQLPGKLEAEARLAASVDGIVVIHPNWWAQPPAILKGWLDRVLRVGICYRFGQKEDGTFGPIGLMQAQAAVVFNTANTPQDQEDALYGDPLFNLWKTCVFGFCGIHQFERRNFTSVIMSTPKQRAEWLNEVETVLARQFGSS